MSESTEELMERQLRELREFEECNPTDVSFWPSPAEVVKEVMEGLTEEQWQIVDAQSRLIAVRATAGCGKTHVLVKRIIEIVNRGNDPQKCVAISFTRRAAGELSQRLAKEGIRIGFSGTVHSWGLSLINDRLDKSISAAPQSLVDRMFLEEQKAAGSRMPAEHVMRRVDQLLEAQKLVSFDRILRILNDPVFVRGMDYLHDYAVFIDEAQDSGPVERAFYELIQPSQMMIIADPRQTLYAFRGADPDSFDRMADVKNMQRYELTQNFRSTPEIQRLSESAFIGGPEYQSIIEANTLDLAEIALRIAANPPNVVLAGQNATVESLTSELKAYGLTVTGKSRPTPEQLALESYLRWQANPFNDALLTHLLEMVDLSVLKVLKETAMRRLCDLCDVVPPDHPILSVYHDSMRFLQEQNPTLSLLELAELVAEPLGTNGQGLLVTTVHQFKGLEADSVAFCDDLGSSPHHHRMRYVATSRAKTRLSIYKLAGGYR